MTDLDAQITRIMRDDRGRLLSALIRALGDFDLAEECLSEAMERALVHWDRSGLPNRPDAWLLQVARRCAIDRIRKDQLRTRNLPDVVHLMEEDEDARAMDTPEIPDERLRLIFTCCHPALDEKSRVALTLRTVGGLSTRDIALSFLDSEPTMGQRLSRAKAKIGAAKIPYAVPERPEWDDRLASVLTVVYLIFNAGWTAGPDDAPIRANLCEEAIWLAQLLTRLAPDEAEIEGLLALMLLAYARREARLDATGAVLQLDDQNRDLWDGPMIKEGVAVLEIAMARKRPGPFQIQAAIAALHAEAASSQDTDWPQIVLLYDRLRSLAPSPVVTLNLAVALAEAGSLDAARSTLEDVRPALESYQPFHAADADLARRAGDVKTAHQAYDKAIELSQNESERAWLERRRAGLSEDL